MADEIPIRSVEHLQQLLAAHRVQATPELERSDSVSDDKVQQILAHCEKLHERFDTMETTHKELLSRVEKLEQAGSAHDPDSDARLDTHAHLFSEAQMRCDRAYQAWSRQAPPGLAGEHLADYRRRLLKQLQPYSKRHKDVDLTRVSDERAFAMLEGEIIADAIEASNVTFTPMAELREQVIRTDSGHIMRKFIGSPAVCWSPFMGGAVAFGKIVRQQSARP